MEDKLKERRADGGKIFALVYVPSNENKYVVREYNTEGIVRAVSFSKEGQALDYYKRCS